MSTFRTHPEDGATAPSRWWRWPALIVAVLYVLPLAGSGGATNPNEIARIELAVSMAFWARVDLGNVVEIYGLSEDVAIRDGKVYSDKAPGLSTVAAPLTWIVAPVLPRAPSSEIPSYWPLRHILTLALVALPGVGLALLLATAVPDLDPAKRSASVLIAALATPLWAYSSIFFGHAPAALLVAVAWFALLGRPGWHDELSNRRAVLGGAAAGFAVATEYPTILIVAVIFATLIVRRTPLATLAAAGVGALGGVLPALVYHQLAFGAPWLTGYGFKAHSDFQAVHERGILGISVPTISALWGILFSPHRGLFFYSPLLLIAPVGLRRMVKKHGWRDAGPMVAALSVYVLFAAGFVDWQAGWCTAARHLVPVVPLMTVAALYGLVTLGDNPRGGLLGGILIAVSGLHAVLTIALTPFFPPQFRFPFADLVLPSLADGAGFWNIVSSMSGAPPVAVVVFCGLVVVGAMVWAAGKIARQPSRWLPAGSAVTIAALLLLYAWLGSRPTREAELMRSQVLRRLGHEVVAERIEASLPAASAAEHD